MPSWHPQGLESDKMGKRGIFEVSKVQWEDDEQGLGAAQCKKPEKCSLIHFFPSIAHYFHRTEFPSYNTQQYFHRTTLHCTTLHSTTLHSPRLHSNAVTAQHSHRTVFPSYNTQQKYFHRTTQHNISIITQHSSTVF